MSGNSPPGPRLAHNNQFSRTIIAPTTPSFSAISPSKLVRTGVCDDFPSYNSAVIISSNILIDNKPSPLFLFSPDAGSPLSGAPHGCFPPYCWLVAVSAGRHPALACPPPPHSGGAGACCGFYFFLMLCMAVSALSLGQAAGRPSLWDVVHGQPSREGAAAGVLAGKSCSACYACFVSTAVAPLLVVDTTGFERSFLGEQEHSYVPVVPEELISACSPSRRFLCLPQLRICSPHQVHVPIARG